MGKSFQNSDLRSFGSSERLVTPVGLGGEGVLRTHGRTVEAQAVILAAQTAGITYFDSGRVYADSEVYLGSVYVQDEEIREGVFQASKSACRDYQGAMTDLTHTLARLQTDYLDLWQIHDVRTKNDLDRLAAPDGALKAFVEARAAGRVKQIGVTGHENPEILSQAVAMWPVDAVMMPVNPVEAVIGGFLDQTLPLARKKGLAVIAMKVLGGGYYVAPLHFSIKGHLLCSGGKLSNEGFTFGSGKGNIRLPRCRQGVDFARGRTAHNRCGDIICQCKANETICADPLVWSHIVPAPQSTTNGLLSKNVMEPRMIDQTLITSTSRHVHIAFKKTRRVLSSAPYHGGLVDARHLLILSVMDNFQGDKGPFEPIATTFDRYCRQEEWTGFTVGMMTSAAMTSFRQVTRNINDVEISILLTAGVSNARRAGDPAEHRTVDDAEMIPGTINIIVLTNATLTPAAQVEAVMVATEAKTAVLQDLGVTSPVTGTIATGTGTDATAVVNGVCAPTIPYCGKHTLFGELLAKAVMEGLAASLKKVNR